MDCITFQKNIKAYLEDELNDQELCDFLQHLRTCPSCADELEINYIAWEGIKILDTDGTDYDLSGAFKKIILKSFSRFKFRKKMTYAAYIVDTLLIWFVAASVFVYLRFMINGILNIGL